MRSALALLLALTLQTTSAAALPRYAKGRATLVIGGNEDDSRLVPYRTLRRSDFRGKKVPPEFAAVANRVGAATCGKVTTTPRTALAIERRQVASGKARYRLTVKHLSFRALMDPECSFWNSKVAAFSTAYVLEHEQIHFALFELGARRLNASAKAVARNIEQQGDSRSKLQSNAENELRRAVQKEMAQIVRRNDAFDEDTSLGYRPKRQKAWLERVTAELRDTARWAVR